ncbi:histidine phosphatase family protein [Schnuerera sp. xch1]|uniref:histidine phosphatase family protein n=1 Tax=Schnuerera sp. xch1 TaxID=2874283 RepID=UPI001CBB645B|nr:histidine phosphatase family protein [Schnuerera sp. xch1]MBZ2173788.1 histidine phosphatase family protein [Schnuerera sp. xch1]
MKKIYLVRHGESKWNILKKIQGQYDIELTQRGLNQADLIGKRLVDEKIKKIYSSDLIRAYKTAEIIGNKLKLDIVPMEEFREINFGMWEGLSIDEIKSRYSKDYALWRKEPEKLKIKDAESLFELQSRAIKGINKIINNDNINNILIVSHSATIKAMILGLLDIDLKNFKNFSLKNVSLSIIEMRDYNNVLSLLNDTNHIKEKL